MTAAASERASFLGLYRAGMSTAAHRRHITIARQPTVQDVVEHLRGSMSRKSKHHFLFIGPRGIGKTHLLALIEDEIAAAPELAAHYVVARFPEEPHRLLSFADFLLGLCEILRDRLPEEPIWRELHATVAAEPDNAVIVDTLVPAIRRQNRERKRTLLIMLENLQELFNRQIRNPKDVGALRKFLMDANGCLLIATAPTHFAAIANVSAPFYDFFDVQVLDLLDREQAIELIRRNLEWDRHETLLHDFAELRPKLMALYDMTGGSPRLLLMLYELIVHDSVVRVREQFLQLLDRVTPFYQDRMRDVAPQERAVLESIALMRDEPKTPAGIAARVRLTQQQTSSLLKRLTASRYLKSEPNPEDKRSRLYAIREGFFDIWLAMNLSRVNRRRLPVLVDCLARFYPQWNERERKRREYRQQWGDANAKEGLDLLSEIGMPAERAEAKLDLAWRNKGDGLPEQSVAYLEEARQFSLDPMGTWIVRQAGAESSINYLDEIQEMIACWSHYRTGDLEAFVERLEKIGDTITLKTFSEAKLSFLRNHLSLVTNARERIRLRSKIGNLLHELARWQEAEKELQIAREEAESLGDNALIALSLNNLVHLFLDINRLAEAEPLVRRALAIDEQSFGTGHDDVAVHLNNLAALLFYTNRLAEAEPLMRRALAIAEQSYGADHPTVAIRLNNLATLLWNTNRLAEAEPLIRRALAIAEQSYGADHPSVAIHLSNLAMLLNDANRLAEAEPLVHRALAIHEQYFGPVHPKVATCLNNLARVLMDTNRLAEAEPLVRRALAIGEQSFGTDHPNVACELNNLAQLLQNTNRLAEAEPLMRRCIGILQQFRQTTGHEHPHAQNVMRSYHNLLAAVKLSKADIESQLREFQTVSVGPSREGPDD